MKRLNYYQVHKNKKPVKLKYSRPYTKQMLITMRKMTEFFIEESRKLRSQE